MEKILTAAWWVLVLIVAILASGAIQWLKGLGFKQDDVIVGRAKSWVAADLFVDDKPANIIDWAVDNPSGRAVLLAWPCNVKHDPLPLNARRLSPDELLTQLRIGAPTW